MKPALDAFLRGRGRAPVHSNGEPFNWNMLANCLGAPARPRQAQALACVNAALRQYPDDAALQQRSLIEACGEQGLVPEAWTRASTQRRFWVPAMGGAPSEDLATAPGGMSLALTLGGLGAPLLGTAEALVREALHRHWDPATRRAHVQWEIAEDQRIREEGEVYSWMRQWNLGDELTEGSEELRVTNSLPAAYLQDLQRARGPSFPEGASRSRSRSRNAPEVTRDLQRLRDARATGDVMLTDTFLSQEARWCRMPGEPTLLWYRLWASLFLDEASKHGVPATTPINGAGGPTREQLHAFYAPLLTLCGLGILPGAFSPSGARLLVVMSGTSGKAAR